MARPHRGQHSADNLTSYLCSISASREMHVIDFEINLCHKRVFTNDLLPQWVVHKERPETEGERADWKVIKTGQMLQKGEKRVS